MKLSSLSRVIVRTGVTAFALSLLGGLQVAVTSGSAAYASSPANAASAPTRVAPHPVTDVPPTPVAQPFSAPLCDGPTEMDPTQSSIGGTFSLDMVWGGRLDAYNAGDIVPLYSTRGLNLPEEPTCTTRYVAAAGGPVSEWTYCTDRGSQPCNLTNVNGDIFRPNGTPVGAALSPWGQLPSHPRLTADQEKLIAYLIQYGHSYHGVGDFDLGVSRGTSDLGAKQRVALQWLVWCISDPWPPTDEGRPDPDWVPTCEASIGAAEQARILSLVTPTPALNVSPDNTGRVDAGDLARFSITTNVYGQPIRLHTTSSGPVSLTVCHGQAALDGRDLTVRRPLDGGKATVTICVGSAHPGTLTLSATATPTASKQIQWSQSQNPDGFVCQVYATFTAESAQSTSDSAAVTVFRVAPKVRTETSSAVAVPGVVLHDKIRIRGLLRSYTGTGTASLYGPFESRSEASCFADTMVGSVGFQPHNGRVVTRGIRVDEPGYYTWVARLSADDNHAAATHRCGMASETSLVRKKPLTSPPDVEGGFSGTVADKQSPRAGSLTFAGIRVHSARTNVAGVARGDMVLPSDPSDVAWLRRSATPGDTIGTAVIAGHVSDQHNNPGALWNLHHARRGQRVSYTSARGVKTTYRVVSMHSYTRGELPRSAFSTTGRARLALVTCTGIVYDGSRFHYTQNLVVMAVPVAHH